ncbi:MAG: PD40 domain-containing protein [Bacteroidales bacterium]|nr:PD40 domain-containing protein [Bacteroidales bacterium]
MKRIILISYLFLCFSLVSLAMKKDHYTLGIFEHSCDVGKVQHPGTALYDSITETFKLIGSGTNMWFDKDEFFFTWRKIKGNAILYSQVAFPQEGVNLHRKAGLIIRESLEPGSPYVSAAYHGDGLISMQYRTEKDSATYEFRAQNDSLPILQLSNHENKVVVMAAGEGEPLDTVGELAVSFTGDKEYYIGLFVCSHDPDVVEEARFMNTRLTVPAKDDFTPYKDYIGARLEILDIETNNRKIVFESDLPIEAPNWSRDGKYFIVNAGGLIYRIPVEGGKAEVLPTGFATSNNNDHGISPDGSLLVISNHVMDPPSNGNSVIHTLPIEGGTPKAITANSPSYWHGWSPDGKYLIYTAQRNEQWDIWRIPATGGDEEQLTNVKALDDGSEYSPDGKYIWFNSNRSGSMEIWRMDADGSNPMQVTDDAWQNWFAHESPNGDCIIFLSYPPEVDLGDHPYYKQVMLRTFKLENDLPVGPPKVVAHLYGGQGTINVHSWSPDGKKAAFVSNSSRIE